MDHVLREKRLKSPSTKHNLVKAFEKYVDAAKEETDLLICCLKPDSQQLL